LSRKVQELPDVLSRKILAMRSAIASHKQAWRSDTSSSFELAEADEYRAISAVQCFVKTQTLFIQCWQNGPAEPRFKSSKVALSSYWCFSAFRQ